LEVVPLVGWHNPEIGNAVTLGLKRFAGTAEFGVLRGPRNGMPAAFRSGFRMPHRTANHFRSSSPTSPEGADLARGSDQRTGAVSFSGGVLAAALWVPWMVSVCSASSGDWNQWLGGPQRTLQAAVELRAGSAPVFVEAWRRTLGSGYAGVSVCGTNAVTAMTDGGQDLAVLLDAADGTERWRQPLGRTRRRGEGVPRGPLSTPALDAEAAYVQAMDGRLVCLDLSGGRPRWEVNLKRTFQAHEPSYGFASSPLLLDDLVVVTPAGSSSGAVAALDRRTGAVRWRTSLGGSAEYTSATWWPGAQGGQILAHLGTKLAGLSPGDGRKLWELDGVAGGLWTASIVAGGHAFMPTAEQTRLLESGADAVREVWKSPVFEGAMGPVVEVNGLLIGHHERRLTALDASSGTLMWQQPEETDGQLLALGEWLVFVNDRAGILDLLAVRREGATTIRRQTLFKPTRMETPLTFARGTLYVRAPEELVALRME